MAELNLTKTEYYRYSVENFQIVIGSNKPITLSNININTFDIERAFDDDYFTILHVNMNLDPETYYSIMENKTDTIFIIKVIKFVFDPNNPTTKTNVSESFNSKFVMFPLENDANLSKDLYKATTDTVGTNRGSYLKTNFDAYLFRYSDMMAANKVVNTVISSSNLTNVLGYLFSVMSCNYVRMTPLDNKNTYKEIVLRPVSILENIVYLDKQYGFYNHGMMLFFDYYFTYLLDKRAECTSYKVNEYKDVFIIVYPSSNANTFTGGVYADKTNRTFIVHVTQDAINFQSSSLAENQITGNSFNVINLGSGSSTSVSPNVTQIGNARVSTIVNSSDNKFATKELEYRKLENDNVLQIGLVDYDANLFAPNKKYTVKFMDNNIQKTHGGSYRISDSIHAFTKQGDNYSAKGYITLKRIK